MSGLVGTARRVSNAEMMMVVLLMGIAIALRVYGIDRPLWMDELWSFRLVQLGPSAMIDNSWTDQSPPLFYFMQYAATGFGVLTSEVFFRSLSLICGIAVVILVWRFAHESAGRFAAVLAGFLAATSPTLIYYSQEGRPYELLLCIAVVSLWPLQAILRGIPRKRTWIAWTILSVLGVNSGYAYLMIVFVQALFIVWRYPRQREPCISIAVVALLMLLLVPAAASSMGSLAARTGNMQPPTVWFTAQAMLAADPNRYGFSVAHAWAPVLVGALVLAGSYWGLRRAQSMMGAYFVIQLVAPMALYFGFVEPVLHLNITTTETKQFLPLLAAVYLLLAGGIAYMSQRAGMLEFPARAALAGATVLLLCLNAIGIERLWTISKSPEGTLAIAVRDQLAPGDAVASLHYSPDRAVGYYLRDAHIQIYTMPHQDSGRYFYKLARSDTFFEDQLSAQYTESSISIRNNHRAWVLWDSRTKNDARDALVKGCQISARITSGPFEAARIEGCLDSP